MRQTKLPATISKVWLSPLSHAYRMVCMPLCCQSGEPTKFGSLVRISRKDQFLGRKIGNDFPSKIWMIVNSKHPVTILLSPFVSRARLAGWV